MILTCQHCTKVFEQRWANQRFCSHRCGMRGAGVQANKRHKARRQTQQLDAIREYVLELRAANKREQEERNT